MSVPESHGGVLQPWGWENVTEAEEGTGGGSGQQTYNKEGQTDPLLNRGRGARTISSTWSVLAISAVFVVVVVGIISQIVEYEAIHGTAAVAIRCVDNTACASAGMIGDCCPTYSGQRLACCAADDNYVTRHITTVGACDDNSACAKLGISGLCCPTASGNDLACCTEDSNVVRKPHAISAACSANSACHFQKLSGNCCPTDDGNMLGCCPPGAADEADDDDDDDSGRRRKLLPWEADYLGE
jgi:hypothetical protein